MLAAHLTSMILPVMKSPMPFVLRLPVLLLVTLLLLPGYSRADAWLVEVRGAIGPASADHVVRGLQQAQAAGAELVIPRIDTPGGWTWPCAQ